MDEERPRKRQTTKFIRSARTKRIVERRPEGFGYDEFSGQEKLTEWRGRQILRAGSLAVIPAGIQSSAPDGCHFLAALSPAPPDLIRGPHPRAS